MDHIELHRGGREEAFPETAEDWPYIAERAEFARYPGNSVPWHWHSEVELFYMEQGAIDYRTRAAHEHVRFEEGSAGFINGGVLHSTLQSPNSAPAIQMLHIFQPSMLGDPAGRLQKRYINPLLQCRGVDVLKWLPTNPDDMPFIDLLKSSFNHDLQRPQNEMALRNSLSELWIQIYAKAEPLFFLRQRLLDDQPRRTVQGNPGLYPRKLCSRYRCAPDGICSRRKRKRVLPHYRSLRRNDPGGISARIPRKPCLQALGTHHANGTDGRAPMRLCDSKPSWPGI